MERMKKISMLCVLVALVAPAMAVSFYEIPASGTYGTDAFQGYNYNPTPDPVAVSNFYTGYVAPYSPALSAPYYVPQGAGPVTFNDPTAEVRFNYIFARFNVGSNLTVGKMYMGDAYWPQGYTGYNNTPYGFQSARQSAGSVTVGTFNFGRPNEFVTNPGVLPIATRWNIRGGSLNITDLKVLNTDTTTSYSELTNEKITSEQGTDALTVNIGNIYLNKTMLYLSLNCGTWNVTGDIGMLSGATAGNMRVAIIDNKSTAGGAKLNIKWSELMQLIDAGQLAVLNGGATTVVSYTQSLAGTTITRANMYQELDLAWTTTPGMVNVQRYNLGTVPEPATLSLLGLGALAMFRRKR